ncbi:hypothetical protein SAICODRAFT_17014 [Saitoella complicata NRRL Y-17804]|uniref:Uncharacterized protein n=1 Tax=Saitoella complicata (strain BCRC 22490 / CBS 7301 / JCM 7358 / NBRC 10748 / NRRL Y-17804) TaxID=698492 RepID=A0A0E9NB32_SAICN|nr:uncharacterized protein SAICODRAFT_17014 [Saitoella complicata NRRL Y-17804]ODQ55253.1 hypothetical protein SAICODRAFT_17014 [Saitoella complicata NRRL Y-17804]GAO47087.1 hypothetical protein G7K_1299-t1 [Saitoella complicata NRRL Y-17804]
MDKDPGYERSTDDLETPLQKGRRSMSNHRIEEKPASQLQFMGRGGIGNHASWLSTLEQAQGGKTVNIDADDYLGGDLNRILTKGKSPAISRTLSGSAYDPSEGDSMTINDDKADTPSKYVRTGRGGAGNVTEKSMFGKLSSIPSFLKRSTNEERTAKQDQELRGGRGVGNIIAQRARREEAADWELAVKLQEDEFKQQRESERIAAEMTANMQAPQGAHMKPQ